MGLKQPLNRKPMRKLNRKLKQCRTPEMRKPKLKLRMMLEMRMWKQMPSRKPMLAEMSKVNTDAGNNHCKYPFCTELSRFVCDDDDVIGSDPPATSMFCVSISALVISMFVFHSFK